jgi:peptidoglycan/LPS O-acetylase OafA/YrhL
MSKTKDLRPDIEGLRGVAILLVILYHAKVPGFAGGYVGVDVFYVLSGYLTSRSRGRFSLRRPARGDSRWGRWHAWLRRRGDGRRRRSRFGADLPT